MSWKCMKIEVAFFFVYAITLSAIPGAGIRLTPSTWLKTPLIRSTAAKAVCANITISLMCILVYIHASIQNLCTKFCIFRYICKQVKLKLYIMWKNCILCTTELNPQYTKPAQEKNILVYTSELSVYMHDMHCMLHVDDIV